MTLSWQMAQKQNHLDHTAHHLTPVRVADTETRQKTTSVGRDVEKGPLCLVGGDTKQSSGCGKQYGGGLRKLNRRSPRDPATPLPDIYPREAKAGTSEHSHTCVHSSFTLGGQGVGASHVSTMDSREMK